MWKRTSAICLTATLALAGCSRSPQDANQSHSDSPPLTQTAAVTPDAGPSADELVAAANELILAKDGTGAMRKLNEAVAREPGRAELYVKRAALAMEGRLYSTAIRDMNAAIKLEPENPRHRNTRGYFYLVSEQLDAADRDFNDAIGLDLNYPQAYNNRGLVSIARKDYAAAITDFDNALRVDPQYVDALNNRGFALIQMKEYAEAIAALSLAIERKPDFLNAVTNRAEAQFLAQNYADAAADYTRAIELQPKLLSFYASRAKAWRAAGVEDKARADEEHVAWTQRLRELDQWIARDQRKAAPWVERGELFLWKKDRAAARDSFEKGLVAEPASTPAALALAKLNLEDGHYNQVVVACSKVLAQGESFDARALRGDALFELGRLDEAIVDFQATRRFDGNVIVAYQQRAAQHRQAGREQQAVEDDRVAQSLLLKQQASASPAQAPEFPAQALLEQSASDQNVVQPAAAEMPAE